MRKSFTKILLAAVAFCTALSAEAYDFEAAGIYYNITSETGKTVEVTSGDSDYSGDITIPATVTNSGTTYTVTSIGESAFSGCSSLASVNFGKNVAIIKMYAFAGCTGLTYISLPEGIMDMREYAFSGCSSLASVTFPDKIMILPNYLFSGCKGIERIYSLSSTPPLCYPNCLDDADRNTCVIYVPEGTTDMYKAANVWKEFYNIVETDFAGSDEIAADAAADVKVYAAAGRIVVENAAAGTPIAVYSADGMMIYGGVVSDTFTEIPAPAGKLYIVKCGNAVFKTVM